MWHAGSLVVACRLLIAACVWDLVPQPRIEPGPPALGVQSLTHWTTKKVSHLIFKLQKFKYKEKILKDARRMETLSYGRRRIRITMDFLSETMQTRGERSEILERKNPPT